MSHEILAAKLCEFDSELAKLHMRIRNGECMPLDRLGEEIENLKYDIKGHEDLIRESLNLCRADISDGLKIEFVNNCSAMLEKVKDEFIDCKGGCAAEKQLLLAEYGIDFAMIISNYALLLSLKAIETQRKEEEKTYERS